LSSSKCWPKQSRHHSDLGAVGHGKISRDPVAGFTDSPHLVRAQEELDPKQGLDTSFFEVTLSLMVWSFLLGPAGAVLGVPLTIALRRLANTPRVTAVQEA
jgi:hypothetical protein